VNVGRGLTYAESGVPIALSNDNCGEPPRVVRLYHFSIALFSAFLTGLTIGLSFRKS
jgi:hypothetical protein